MYDFISHLSAPWRDLSLPSLVSIGKSVTWNSPGSPSWCSGWYEEFEHVADAPISDSHASYAQSDDIVVGFSSSSIVTVAVVDERIQYEPK